MKARIKFKKYGAMRFIGHLDVMRYFQKVMRRAEIPIAFTSGYSPHMIMSFAQPLGLGVTSDAEYFDIELVEAISSKEAVAKMNQVMVEGIEVVSFVQIPDEKKYSGMTIVAGADYLVTRKNGEIKPEWKEAVDQFMEQNEIVVLKKTKRSEKEVDIKPMIFQFSLEERGFFLSLATGSERNLKPDLVMDTFMDYVKEDKDTMDLQFHRLEVYAVDPKTSALCSLESLGNEFV